MLKRLIFKQETALHLGLPTLVWNVRIRLVWVSRESGGKVGRTQYLHLSASPQMLSVCVWGFEGKCLCQWHPPLVSIQYSQGQMKQNHLRRRLISTTQLTPTWIPIFSEKNVWSPSNVSGAFQRGCPSLMATLGVKDSWADSWHISHSSNSPLLPIWWQFPRTTSLLRRAAVNLFTGGWFQARV